MPRVNAGAIVVGTMVGLGGMLVVFALAGALGDFGSGVLLPFLLQYAAQLGAGYVAGRLGREEPVLNGGAAGLLLFAVGSTISLAVAAARPSLAAVAFGAVVAAVLGSAGGALAYQQREEDPAPDAG